jgi:flagellar protein FlaG
MGFSLTGAHIVFFIAAILVAGAVSGVFVAITMNITTSFSERGDRIQEKLDTEFKIINDPENIPISGSDYVFYLKNIGNIKLSTTNETFQLFLDGDIISISNYNFSDNSIQTTEYTKIYVAQNELSIGNHRLRLVGPLAIEDEFKFTIT